MAKKTNKQQPSFVEILSDKYFKANLDSLEQRNPTHMDMYNAIKLNVPGENYLNMPVLVDKNKVNDKIPDGTYGGTLNGTKRLYYDPEESPLTTFLGVSNAIRQTAIPEFPTRPQLDTAGLILNTQGDYSTVYDSERPLLARTLIDYLAIPNIEKDKISQNDYFPNGSVLLKTNKPSQLEIADELYKRYMLATKLYMNNNADGSYSHPNMTAQRVANKQVILPKGKK